MFIKSLKIQGFKSYRDETIVDPFSPGLNLLVGRNGSGKSNFFSAIRFVLCDAYTSLSREERGALLHDGSTGGGAGGAATMSAYVEVEFDNSDGRFPTNKPTMCLRRTIGLKKDEYQLDRKSTSKGEVMSILESAGFSRSNPYYIVPQGRITHLTNQKDQDRLLLLKEVAGTKVYEERRAESIKVMEETNVKREKIKDALTFIDDRLTELEEEKEELKQFQVQDRQRRSLEYCIYQRELHEVAEKLEDIEDERRRDVDLANNRRAEFNEREKDLLDLDQRIMTEKQRLENLSIEHRQANGERRDAIQASAEVECLVNDAKEGNRKTLDTAASLRQEIERIEVEISKKEVELMEIVPTWEDKVAEETEVRQRLQHAETTLRTLFAKQGRVSQFKSQKERDAHLRKAIAETTATKATRAQRKSQLQRDLQGARSDLATRVDDTSAARLKLDHRKEALAQLSKELISLKEKQHIALERRKDLWKEDSKLDSQLRAASEQLKAAESTLSSSMDRDTALGLKASQEISTRLGLTGFFGPLYELFSVEDRYRTAVEVTAGNSLFHIVVDSDETATQILNVMMKEKKGRVTYIPLNRLKSHEVKYPSAKEAVAMISKLTFDPAYTKAFQQVFGRTVICQSLEVAGAYTRSHDLNSITLAGDKYDRKGSLTGGYHDIRRSRLEAVKILQSAGARHKELKRESDEVKSATLRLDQEVTQLLGQIQIADAKSQRLAEDREPIVAKVLLSQEEEDRARARVIQLESLIRDQESSIANLETETSAYQAELKTQMEQRLSEAETAQVTSLSNTVDEFKENFVTLSKGTSELERAKSLLEIELNENLRRRREDLRMELEICETAGPQMVRESDSDSREKDLRTLQASIKELGSKIDDLDAEIDAVKSSLTHLEKSHEKKELQQAEDSLGIAKQQKAVERYLMKRQLLLSRKDDCNKNIRDLGVLPEEAFGENTASSDKLLKKLRKINEALKVFAHVNKKAYEQYTSFTRDRDELLRRQADLDSSSTSIADLIEYLDNRKDEAIERTFKQVATYFSEVFEKLVPAGKGRLLMQKRFDVRKDQDMDVDDAPDGENEEVDNGVENYTGVAIRVSFNSKSNEGLKIQQLSGGQKALVALALIFAIQKCDPAPFYLFDEIDANLDADRRTGVAAMIDELSQSGQYICTTFRPELIRHAESFFGVVFNATKVSTVKSITAEECMSFVEAAEQVRA